VFRAARVIRPTCAAPRLLVQTAVLFRQSPDLLIDFEQSLPNPLTHAQSSRHRVTFQRFFFLRHEPAAKICGQ
jgi:hypothetical protein